MFDTYSIGAERARPLQYASDRRQELRHLVNDLAVYNLPAFNELSKSLGASGLWDELSPITLDHGEPFRPILPGLADLLRLFLRRSQA